MNRLFKNIKLKYLFNIFIKKYYMKSLMVFTRLIKNGKETDHSDFSALIDTYIESFLEFSRKYNINSEDKSYFIKKYVDLIKSHKNKYIDGIYYDISYYFIKQSRKKVQIERDINSKVEYIQKMFDNNDNQVIEYVQKITNHYKFQETLEQSDNNHEPKINLTLISTTMIDIIALLNTNKILPLHVLDPYLMEIKTLMSYNDVSKIRSFFEKDFKEGLLSRAIDKTKKYSNNLMNIDICKTLMTELTSYFNSHITINK